MFPEETYYRGLPNYKLSIYYSMNIYVQFVFIQVCGFKLDIKPKLKINDSLQNMCSFKFVVSEKSIF